MLCFSFRLHNSPICKWPCLAGAGGLEQPKVRLGGIPSHTWKTALGFHTAPFKAISRGW